jgi:uncharacterized membrane protein YkvA (DUF1232 family)
MRSVPLDLIPDFVPILGYLDDLVLIPIGVALAIRMVPPHVLDECRVGAQQLMSQGKPVSRIAGAAIAIIWITLAVLLTAWVYETLVSGKTP